MPLSSDSHQFHPHRHATLLLLAALLGLASLLTFSSLPLTSAQQIRIPLTRRDIPDNTHHYRSAHATVAHAERNFAGPMPSRREAMALYSDPGREVALKNFYNRMYTGTVQIGSPAKTYNLVFDTGSADLWVFSAQTTKSRLDYVTYYDSSLSTTSKRTNTPWSIQYGKGASSGTLVSDTVALAGRTASGFTFAQATDYTDDFESSDMPLDGLLGLAFQEVNSAGGPTLLDALQSNGQIKERVFSFYLTSDNPTGSEFVLGSPDLNYTAGGQTLTYLDLASTSGMWILSMQAVTVGSATSSYCSTSSNCPVLLDTGTSFIGMPASAFSDWARKINAARSDCLVDSNSGLIRCDRDTADGLPSMGFSIQGSLFTIQAKDYFQSGVLGFMSLSSSSSGRSNFWILGDTFLKTYYTVYDMDARKIGIVGAKPGVPYTPPSSESPYRSFGWQWVIISIAIVIGLVLLCLCCARARHNQSPPSQSAPPYMLHQPPPVFHSEAYPQQQQAQMAPPRSAHQYPGQPLKMSSPQPPVAARSEFARDFYGTGQV